MKIKLFTNSGIFDRSVSIDGFTMTGHLTLARNPMTGQEAATKRYVDNYPYNLDVENIVGGPVAIERFASGISGDVAMYNGNQTVLKSVAAAGSYGRVIVNAKGQVVSGMAPSVEAADPTLAFNEITGRPSVVSGYVTDPSAYIRNTAGVDNAAFTGALTLSRAPTTDTELATYGYLTGKVNAVVAGYKVGELVLKPNTVAQTGFLKANGGVLDKATYAALYAVIGDVYSPSGAGGYMGQPWRQQYAFNTTQSDNITGWSSYTSLPASSRHSQAIVTKNRVYLIGGVVSGINSSAVYTAPINADGTLGAWGLAATVLPAAASYSQAIVTKNRVYLIGGNSSSVVYTVPINADGTLGTWVVHQPLPAAVQSSQVVVTSSRVYLLGGLLNGVTSIFEVYTAPLNTDGTLGAWALGTPLPVSVYNHQVVTTKNRVYLLGGNNSAAVYTALINTDGTIGPWAAGTSLPTIIYYTQAVVTKNRVYLLGNYSGFSVYTAPVNADGTIGTWEVGTSLPAVVNRSQAIVTSSRIYLIGGGSSGTVDVYSASFLGGASDYLTLITNNTLTTTTQFKLPDLSEKSSGIYDYYIRAV